MEVRRLDCVHCKIKNIVAICLECGKAFVITMAHLQGRQREYEDREVEEIQDDLEINYCDFCRNKSQGNTSLAVIARLRQKTCPACHRDFLSTYGL